MQALQGIVRTAYRTWGATAFEVGHNGATIQGFRMPAPEEELGSPLVLLHGLGDSSTAWYQFAKHMRAARQVTVVDLPGHGRSTLPKDTTFLMPSVKAAALVRVIEHLEGRPVTLVGTSLGGWVAMHVALQRPDLVDRLVLVAPAGIIHPGALSSRTLLQPQDVDEVLHLWSKVWHQVPRGARFIAKQMLPHYHRDLIVDFLEKTPVQEMLGPAQLRRLTMPTLVFWGTDDGLLPSEYAGLLYRYLPDVEVTWLARCGHLPQQERPAMLASRMLDFFER